MAQQPARVRQGAYKAEVDAPHSQTMEMRMHKRAAHDTELQQLCCSHRHDIGMDARDPVECAGVHLADG